MLKQWGFFVGYLSVVGMPNEVLADELIQNEKRMLKPVSVTATRIQRALDQLPNTISVIDHMQIEAKGARDIKDVLRDELGVQVQGGIARFNATRHGTGRGGNEGINIRGLEGNQILMLVDGIRLPNGFTFGGFSTGRGDFLDINAIRTIEILRGPASMQYGSDGLGGLVSITTLNPKDMLPDGQAFGGFYSSSYTQVDGGWANALGMASENGPWQVMMLASYRHLGETANKGTNHSQDAYRTAPNPQNIHNDYILTKAYYTLSPTQRLGATLETQNRRTKTHLYSAQTNKIWRVKAEDDINRDRVSLSHKYENLRNAWVQKVETQIYHQSASVHQKTNEQRRYPLLSRFRDNRYETTGFGFSSVWESQFDTKHLTHHLIYGGDWSQSDTKGVRNGRVPPRGENFPSRPFPDTRYHVSGMFIQDEVTWENWQITPGVRLDQYRLSPSHKGGWNKVYRLSDRAWSPRIGVLWQWSEQVSPYMQWAKGFRAPTPDQVNNGFSNPAAGYRTEGNPHLKPETVRSWEWGFKGKRDKLEYSLSYFDNYYDQFIRQDVVSGKGIPYVDPLVFQYVNVSKAHIWGVELRTEWSLAQSWKMQTGMAYSWGEMQSAGKKYPLDSIQPLRVIWSLAYDKEDIWGAHMRVQWNRKKETQRLGPLSREQQSQFVPPSYAFVDLGGYWKPTKKLSIHANIFNVLDKKYWRWSDVRGLEYQSQVLDAYTSPGRQVQISLRYQF